MVYIACYFGGGALAMNPIAAVGSPKSVYTRISAKNLAPSEAYDSLFQIGKEVHKPFGS